jgi:RNA polymerase sigma factor (sigma-70 family)
LTVVTVRYSRAGRRSAKVFRSIISTLRTFFNSNSTASAARAAWGLTPIVGRLVRRRLADHCILIDRARHKQTRKAGGGRRLDLDNIEPVLEEAEGDRLLDLDKALRQLEAEDPRKADLVKLRFFAGLTVEQTAAALGVSTSTAEKSWAYARSWLRVAIDRMSGHRP